MRGTHQYIPGHTALFAMCLEKMLFGLQDFLHESFILVSQMWVVLLLFYLVFWHSRGKNLCPAAAAAAAAKSLQSCLTLCDPTDGSPPGSPVPGILQARTLEWVAISFSNAWKWKVKGKSLSRVWPLATPWTATYQTPLSMGFSRQEYWSGSLVPSLSKVSRIYY